MKETFIWIIRFEWLVFVSFVEGFNWICRSDILFQIGKITRCIEMVGLSFSLVSLVISLYIFFSYRSVFIYYFVNAAAIRSRIANLRQENKLKRLPPHQFGYFQITNPKFATRLRNNGERGWWTSPDNGHYPERLSFNCPIKESVCSLIETRWTAFPAVGMTVRLKLASSKLSFIMCKFSGIKIEDWILSRLFGR